MLQTKRLLLAQPRGFCAGVERAVLILDVLLEQVGSPLYVKHDIVHNQHVVRSFEARGVRFVEDLNEVPEGACVVFSAHGVSQAVVDHARKRGLNAIDATCPLVAKVHSQVVRGSRSGMACVLIGHRGHPEVEGTMGHYHNPEGGGIHLVETVEDVARLHLPDPNRVMFVTQTTLSVRDTQAVIAALQIKFPHLQAPAKEDICYATQNRQDAMAQLAHQCDQAVVVGSMQSSNAKRLVELGEHLGCPTHLVDDAAHLPDVPWASFDSIGISAAASTPEHLVQEVVLALQQLQGGQLVLLEGVREDVHFALPKTLRLQDPRREAAHT